MFIVVMRSVSSYHELISFHATQTNKHNIAKNPEWHLRRPVGYLQAWLRSWTLGYREQHQLVARPGFSPTWTSGSPAHCSDYSTKLLLQTRLHEVCCIMIQDISVTMCEVHPSLNFISDIFSRKYGLSSSLGGRLAGWGRRGWRSKSSFSSNQA